MLPRYFFDTDDGERQVRDDNGIDLSGHEAIKHETRSLLFDLGHAELLNGRTRVFTAAVRNERGVTVYKGSMVLRIDHDEP